MSRGTTRSPADTMQDRYSSLPVALYLRAPEPEDREAIEALYQRSADIHLPWTHPPRDYEAFLVQASRYLLCHEGAGEIVGTFHISGVVRGYFQSGYLGYEVFSPHAGKGFMRIGLQLLLSEAFGALNLHRLEANIQPGNVASIRLVSGAGFVKEGFSRHYLNIGGKGWKDHERWALVNENWREDDAGMQP
jgi:ribosomal-protein-alanine N-acetyltransferase